MSHSFSFFASLVLLILPTAHAAQQSYHLDFGEGAVAEGYTQILPVTSFNDLTGIGLVDASGLASYGSDSENPLHNGITSTTPYFLMVKAAEGNYRVTVTLGHPSLASDTTIKAELRRMMLNGFQTQPGQYVKETFIVNVRQPQYPGGAVRLKGDRERVQEAWAWDKHLTLEINGKQSCICAIDIEPAPELPTVFLIGDSTVCDQSRGPWNSWGQMLTQFFQPTVAIANHGESGESIRGSLGAKRFDKIYSLIKPGDYLFIQFGHNDMKDRRPNASDTYKSNLKAIVAQVRELGGTPVLITSMERSSGIEQDTLADYPDKMREVAAEDQVALIDLHKQSKILYRALGDRLMEAFQDGTHHNNYGSTQFAQLVLQGIKDKGLDLAQHIRSDFQGYDPAQPDDLDSFEVAVSPLKTTVKPLGD